ncbi:MAG: 3-phosphoshikimate 1-carboxyvinyltransferase [Candidatus Altiarchaeota archaeon]|nr:3-phosphoshikimate 1-carboxyvinyltransferase [Candidatus Altiarchaeota archaeon]
MVVELSDSLEGEAKAPPSKSYTHRAIILSGLARGTSKINDPLLSADPLASMEAIRAGGAQVRVGKGSLVIKGNDGVVKVPKKTVDVENSGTTIRIMTSVFSLCDKEVVLTGDESIRKRPMQPLLDALSQIGVETTSTNGNPPVSVKGPMKGGICRIRGDVSSQYISGLLISCPLAKKDTTVEITTELRSRPYLDLTLDQLRRFGGRIDNQDYKRFMIKGNQSYKATDYTVEGDYSGAAFILAAAALIDSKVMVRNLFKDSKQGDKKIIEILRKMGADLKVGKDSVAVKGGSPLSGIEVDLSQTPDLLPIMSVLGSLAQGKTIIRNVEHARIKECDRIDAMAKGLTKMGARLKEKRDGFEIDGVDSLSGAEVQAFNDHRIVMALAVAGLRAKGKTVIDSAESVAVSFPNFLEVMKTLGANIS